MAVVNTLLFPEFGKFFLASIFIRVTCFKSLCAFVYLMIFFAYGGMIATLIIVYSSTSFSFKVFNLGKFFPGNIVYTMC